MSNKLFLEKIKDLSGNELKQHIMNEKKQQIIYLVCRQTNYSEKEAKLLLEKNNYQYIQIISEYMNPTKQKSRNIHSTQTSTNQKIYGEIRNFMSAKNKAFEQRQNK